MMIQDGLVSNQVFSLCSLFCVWRLYDWACAFSTSLVSTIYDYDFCFAFIFGYVNEDRQQCFSVQNAHLFIYA